MFVKVILSLLIHINYNNPRAVQLDGEGVAERLVQAAFPQVFEAAALYRIFQSVEGERQRLVFGEDGDLLSGTAGQGGARPDGAERAAVGEQGEVQHCAVGGHNADVGDEVVVAQPAAAQEEKVVEVVALGVLQGFLQVVVLLAAVGLDEVSPTRQVAGTHRVAVANNDGGRDAVLDQFGDGAVAADEVFRALQNL